MSIHRDKHLSGLLDQALDDLRAGTGDPLVVIEHVSMELTENDRKLFYEKCAECHLFVEPNLGHEPGQPAAKYIHLARGDDADERIEETHDARPSGLVANLRTWKVYGPSQMRERFFVPGSDD